jgi:ribA/ribD-fused uncharacterized protein
MGSQFDQVTFDAGRPGSPHGCGVSDGAECTSVPSEGDSKVHETHKLDTQDHVFFYENDFYVLSNFSAFQLDWKGHLFPTSEHAYQWEKFSQTSYAFSPTVGFAIMSARSAHVAFKLAQEHRDKRSPGWDQRKLDLMREILRAKANQHEYVHRKLLATGDRELIEDSWRDDFWG